MYRNLIKRLTVNHHIPVHKAPEILDSQPYARKADLWSVGAVLYECLAGRAPFKANNYIELSNVIKKTCDSLPMPPGISTGLADLLRYGKRYI